MILRACGKPSSWGKSLELGCRWPPRFWVQRRCAMHDGASAAVNELNALLGEAVGKVLVRRAETRSAFA